MKETIKRLWTETLRSGRYRQGRGHLRTEDDLFCCLGVLCDLHSQATGTPWEKVELELSGRKEFSYLGIVGYLPWEVMRWAGLDSADPDVGPEANALSFYNDHRYSFDKIAQMIEEDL